MDSFLLRKFLLFNILDDFFKLGKDYQKRRKVVGAGRESGIWRPAEGDREHPLKPSYLRSESQKKPKKREKMEGIF